MSASPGWYRDPFQQGFQRYWDGLAWSVRTRAAEAAPDRQLASDQNAGSTAAVAAMVMVVVGLVLGVGPILL